MVLKLSRESERLRLRKGEKGGREKRRERGVRETKIERRRDRQTDTVRKVLLKNKQNVLPSFCFPLRYHQRYYNDLTQCLIDVIIRNTFHMKIPFVINT